MNISETNRYTALKYYAALRNLVSLKKASFYNPPFSLLFSLGHLDVEYLSPDFNLVLFPVIFLFVLFVFTMRLLGFIGLLKCFILVY